MTDDKYQPTRDDFVRWSDSNLDRAQHHANRQTGQADAFATMALTQAVLALEMTVKEALLMFLERLEVTEELTLEVVDDEP